MWQSWILRECWSASSDVYVMESTTLTDLAYIICITKLDPREKNYERGITKNEMEILSYLDWQH